MLIKRTSNEWISRKTSTEHKKCVRYYSQRNADTPCVHNTECPTNKEYDYFAFLRVGDLLFD